MDANRQAAAVREVANDGDAAGRVDVRDELGEVVNSDDAVREQASTIGLDRGREPLPGGLLVGAASRGSDAPREASRSADRARRGGSAIRRITRGRVDPGRGHGRGVDPELVQFVRPQERRPVRHDTSRSAAVASLSQRANIPTGALEPGSVG